MQRQCQEELDRKNQDEEAARWNTGRWNVQEWEKQQWKKQGRQEEEWHRQEWDRELTPKKKAWRARQVAEVMQSLRTERQEEPALEQALRRGRPEKEGVQGRNEEALQGEIGEELLRQEGVCEDKVSQQGQRQWKKNGRIARGIRQARQAAISGTNRETHWRVATETLDRGRTGKSTMMKTKQTHQEMKLEDRGNKDEVETKTCRERTILSKPFTMWMVDSEVRQEHAESTHNLVIIKIPNLLHGSEDTPKSVQFFKSKSCVVLSNTELRYRCRQNPKTDLTPGL